MPTSPLPGWVRGSWGSAGSSVLHACNCRALLSSAFPAINRDFVLLAAVFVFLRGGDHRGLPAARGGVGWARLWPEGRRQRCLPAGPRARPPAPGLALQPAGALQRAESRQGRADRPPPHPRHGLTRPARPAPPQDGLTPPGAPPLRRGMVRPAGLCLHPRRSVSRQRSGPWRRDGPQPCQPTPPPGRGCPRCRAEAGRAPPRTRSTVRNGRDRLLQTEQTSLFTPRRSVPSAASPQAGGQGPATVLRGKARPRLLTAAGAGPPPPPSTHRRSPGTPRGA